MISYFLLPPSNPFLFLFIFRFVLFSFSRTPPSSLGYRSRDFFFLVNIDRRRRHGFRPRAYTHQATSTLPGTQKSRRERSALPHETTPGGPFEWPLRDGLSSQCVINHLSDATRVHARTCNMYMYNMCVYVCVCEGVYFVVQQ